MTTATTSTLPPEPNLRMLVDSPVRFSFFQALRCIEGAYAELPRVGYAASPLLERFRIRQPADLGFAPSTIDSARTTLEGAIEVDQRFFGLLGPSGPLPIHLTEIVRNRDRHANDGALQAFLDIFHHRMASLFYRAWSSARPVVQRDRPQDDRFAAYVGSLIGSGTRYSFGRDAWDDEAKRFFAGKLGGLHRNMEGLESMLYSVVQCPVKIQPFALRWLPLSRRDRTTISSHDSHRGGASSSNVLGRTTILGERVPDRQGMVEVRLGPMSYSSFETLMPNSARCGKLQAIIRTHSGASMDAVFRPVLRKEEVPRPQLGKLGQLGRNTWIQSRAIESDRDDFCFSTFSSPSHRSVESLRKQAA